MKKEIDNKSNILSELLRIAQVLKDNGVNLRDITLSKMQNRKRKLYRLSEIEQEGVDIRKIIKENRFRS